MDDLKAILSQFHPVSLDEIDEVKLMNRIDRKYWFHISLLNGLLENVIHDYDILEIDGQRLMEYESTYFDSADNFMYIKHHNRKLNRYKLRRRTYLSTNDDFFEVKLKTNKKRTIKSRIPTQIDEKNLLDKEIDFLEDATPFKGVDLQKSLNNHFSRMTLIHKNKLDRCTIDIQPKFWNDKGEIKFDNLVIFELKRGKSLKSSSIVSLLRELKIRQRGLSKYCTGRAMLDPTLKRNAFKPRLRFIEKYIMN